MPSRSGSCVSACLGSRHSKNLRASCIPESAGITWLKSKGSSTEGSSNLLAMISSFPGLQSGCFKCISTFPLALAFHEAFDVLCWGQCRTKPCDKLSPTVKRTNQNTKSAGCIFLRFDTKTSSMSLANHNRCRKSNEPIRMPSQLAKFSHTLIQGHLRSQAREKSVIFVYGTSDKSKKWYNILFIHKRLKVTHLSLYYKSLFLSLQTK